ncbi:hypothetical protein XA68_13390 [Ophiocordyceps unilateralis]|uniref:Uncharacterized protein n=1 Tax=Ophiocordyceps unilateralis TaxID=268505 RepID=A0A2A9PMA4_OPHUN|nr:hypothetical protein XA68_13390 [Ophiocordyceps unilateralis]
MKSQGVFVFLATLVGVGLAAPHSGEASFDNMSLAKREDMAAACLQHLCCPNNKRDLETTQTLQAHQSAAAAQCLVCWKFGICGKKKAAVREGETAKVTVPIPENVIKNNKNFQKGGFWIEKGGRKYWVGENGQYYEWMGAGGSSRLGGHGHVGKGKDGQWEYTFED